MRDLRRPTVLVERIFLCLGQSAALMINQSKSRVFIHARYSMGPIL